MDPVRRASMELQREMEKQVNIVYSAAAIALYRYYGWRGKRILDLLKMTQDAWNECAKDPNTSMLKMLEDETGIEIRARGIERSYHELDFLNGNPAKARPMTSAEIIYMRKRQKPWLNPQIAAALLLALHRKYGWSGERDARLLQYKDEIESEFNWNPVKLLETAEAEVGISIFDSTRKAS